MPPSLVKNKKNAAENALSAAARDRLAQAITAVGGVAEVARRVGMARQTISDALKGESDIGAGRLERICEAAGVSFAWVVGGAYGEPAGDLIRIPIVEVEAAAGFGRRAAEEPAVVDSLTMPLSVARALGVVEKLRTVIVRGDSQQPELNDGDLVMYDASQPYRAPGMYVLVLDGELVVKRLQRTKDGVAVLSSNPAFPPIDVLAEEADERVRVLGKVVWSGRKW